LDKLTTFHPLPSLGFSIAGAPATRACPKFATRSGSMGTTMAETALQIQCALVRSKLKVGRSRQNRPKYWQ
ncbi:MAG: hypothetical protein ACREQD_10760, partial [Candidatus Binataceae bacterium]